jgi:hypothetical protein
MGPSNPPSTLSPIDNRSPSVTDVMMLGRILDVISNVRDQSGFSTDGSQESIDSAMGEGEIPMDEVRRFQHKGGRLPNQDIR